MFALSKKFIDDKNLTKSDIIEIILNKLTNDLAIEVIEHFKDVIGYTASEIQKLLNISNKERLKMAKKGFITVTGTYEVRQYGKYLDCPIYDAIHALNITQNDVEKFRKSIKPLTERQILGLQKAKETSIKNRTCKRCGSVQKNKRELNIHGICSECENIESAKLQRRKWLDNKEKYIIIDTETTGLDYDDEIVEIAIVDLDGNIVFESLIKPSKPIPQEVIDIHGITNTDVEHAPTWNLISNKVLDIIKDKIILAYNSDFDVRMIQQSCKIYGIQFSELKDECIMHNVMEEWGTSKYISLKNAIGEEYQSHRAADDCRMCLKIIYDID